MVIEEEKTRAYRSPEFARVQTGLLRGENSSDRSCPVLSLVMTAGNRSQLVRGEARLFEDLQNKLRLAVDVRVDVLGKLPRERFLQFGIGRRRVRVLSEMVTHRQEVTKCGSSSWTGVEMMRRQN